MGSVNIQSSHGSYGNDVFIVTGCFNLYGNMINDQDSLLYFFWGSWGLSLLATWRTLTVDWGNDDDDDHDDDDHDAVEGSNTNEIDIK